MKRSCRSCLLFSVELLFLMLSGFPASLVGYVYSVTLALCDDDCPLSTQLSMYVTS